MSRGLVLGVSYYEDGDRHERVLVAPDPHDNANETRKAIDRLLGGVPLGIRPEVAQYFAPHLENNEPPNRGTYDQIRYGGQPVIVWWKWAYVHEVSA